MKKFSEISLPNLGHMTAIGLLAATMTACGGSSGGSAGGDDDDGDIDGLFGNTDTLDTDDDGITDAEELLLGTDPNVFDSDLDTDGDGVSNFNEIIAGTDPAVFDNVTDNPDNGTPTGSDCDRNSDTAEWGDNCTVREGGSFQVSSYAKGIQRILWCQGFDADQNLDTFADGNFGPNTAQAARDYQTANFLAVDGEVGPETWTSLFGKLALIGQEIDRNVSTINGENCDITLAQFYQSFDGALLGGWRMADFPGSASSVDFGTGAP